MGAGGYGVSWCRSKGITRRVIDACRSPAADSLSLLPSCLSGWVFCPVLSGGFPVCGDGKAKVFFHNKFAQVELNTPTFEPLSPLRHALLTERQRQLD